MQLIPRYLVNNRINVVSSDSRFVVEYRPVYSRTLNVYKGIDNKIQFRLLNADQKPVVVTGTPKFVAFDEKLDKVLEYDCTVIDDGSTVATRGLFELTITDNDLLNLRQQYLHYNIYLLDDSGSKSLTYANRNFDSAGIIYLNGNSFPDLTHRHEITTFVQTDDLWIAGNTDEDKIELHAEGDEELHTVEVHTEGYAGTVKIQATYDDAVTGTNNWNDIALLTFNGNETSPLAVSFTCVYNFLRVVTDANPVAKVTKVVIRN